jgi:hypothetical protein
MRAFGRRKQQEESDLSQCSYSDSPGKDTGLVPVRESTNSAPRWVKVFWIIVGILVLLFAVLH